MGIKHVTRFNPTANGELHLGHVYTALFNERMAHESGGKFYVRFEDNQIDTLYAMSAKQVTDYCIRQCDALGWLGFKVDCYQRQSEQDLQFKEFVAKHDWFMPEYRWPYDYPLDPIQGADYMVDPIQGADYMEEPGAYLGMWYPYAPYLTYAKVIYDELMGVNMLIRGDDLRSEFSLYQHYRRQLGLRVITHYYIPRLTTIDGGIISKYFNSPSVLDYRDAGWSPDDILELLAISALKKPADGWSIYNVKPHPRLDQALSISL